MTRTLAAVLLLLAVACSETRLERAPPEALIVSPVAIDLGEVLVGESKRVSFSITNGSGTATTLSLVVPDVVQLLDPPRTLGAAAAVTVMATVSVGAAGPFTHRIEVRGEADQAFADIGGTGILAGVCRGRVGCVEELSAGDSCELRNLPDGTTCASPCLIDGSCKAGVCLGTSRGCDDLDLCSVDFCDGQSGCSSVPRACSTTEPCKVAMCDPVMGCVTTDVPDGISCGFADCAGAAVCLSGACVTRPSADGVPCRLSPCSTGACSSGSCANVSTGPLAPTWAVALPGHLSVPAASADGAIFLISEQAFGSVQTQSFVRIDADGGVRYSAAARLSPNEVEPRFDTAIATGAAVVLVRRGNQRPELRAFDRATGAFLWRQDLRALLDALWPELSGALQNAQALPAADDGTIAVSLRALRDPLTAEGCAAGWRSVGALMVFDGASGQLRWSSRSSGCSPFHNSGRPLISREGIVYGAAQSDSGTLANAFFSDGGALWVDVDRHVTAAAHGRAGTGGGRILQAQTGAVISAVNGQIFALTSQVGWAHDELADEIYAFNPATGARLGAGWPWLPERALGLGADGTLLRGRWQPAAQTDAGGPSVFFNSIVGHAPDGGGWACRVDLSAWIGDGQAASHFVLDGKAILSAVDQAPDGGTQTYFFGIDLPGVSVASGDFGEAGGGLGNNSPR